MSPITIKSKEGVRDINSFENESENEFDWGIRFIELFTVYSYSARVSAYPDTNPCCD